MREVPAWLWLNLLSLDAPLVALVWQDFAARSFGNPLRLSARIVLGLTVWAVYLADRLIDTRTAGPEPTTARHRFHRLHSRQLTILLALVLLLDVFFATVELRRDVFVHGLAVALCVGAYLATFPRRPSGWEKQVLAAVLFSAGVLLVSGTWLGMRRLWIPAALFAGLCLCNLFVIEMLESHPARRAIWLVPAGIGVLAVTLPGGPWRAAIALSGFLLAALAIAASRLTANAMRVLADAALLTPLLVQCVNAVIALRS